MGVLETYYSTSIFGTQHYHYLPYPMKILQGGRMNRVVSLSVRFPPATHVYGTRRPKFAQNLGFIHSGLSMICLFTGVAIIKKYT